MRTCSLSFFHFGWSLTNGAYLWCGQPQKIYHVFVMMHAVAKEYLSLFVMVNVFLNGTSFLCMQRWRDVTRQTEARCFESMSWLAACSCCSILWRVACIPDSDLDTTSCHKLIIKIDQKSQDYLTLVLSSTQTFTFHKKNTVNELKHTNYTDWKYRKRYGPRNYPQLYGPIHDNKIQNLDLHSSLLKKSTKYLTNILF